MKKTIIATAVAAFALFSAPVVFANASTQGVEVAPFDWKASKTGTWAGMKDGKTYWYKIDKEAMLWWSTDGKKWAKVSDGMWADKDGKWLKIHEGKLVWTTDGKSWAEVPEWKWEGSDGKWYKFDAKWKLWVNE